MGKDRNSGAKKFLLLRFQERVRPALSPRASQSPLRFPRRAMVAQSFKQSFRPKKAEASETS